MGHRRRAHTYAGGIGDLAYFRSVTQPGLGDRVPRPGAVLVAAAPGQQQQLEALLAGLPSDQVRVTYRSKALQSYAQEVANADLVIWMLNAVTIAVLSLALGLLNIIFFMQRSNEMGLLAAIGYTRGFLVRRAALEAVVTSAIGWCAGIIFSQTVYTLFNMLVFTPKGLAPLTALTQRVLILTTPVPLALTLFGGAVVILQLIRFDSIATIERRD